LGFLGGALGLFLARITSRERRFSHLHHVTRNTTILTTRRRGIINKKELRGIKALAS
jgi:hypothetical protein